MAGRWVDLREAAQELGTSTEAVRKRAARGTLESRKGEDGKLYVRVDTDRPNVYPNAQVEGAGMVEELREQVAYLREQLEAEKEARREESRELRRLLAGLIERVPELESAERPGEPQETSETGSEGPGRVDTPPDQTHPAEADSGPLWHGGNAAPEDPPRRPWWQRWFGS